MPLTLLATTTDLVSASGLALGVDYAFVGEPWPHVAPPADYTLPAPVTASGSATTATIPGLATASVITVCMLLDKQVAAESVYMAIALPDGGSAYTDIAYLGRSYNPNTGLGLNTYTDGNTAGQDRTVLDNNAKVKVTVKLYPGQQTSKFDLYVNGVKQAIGGFEGQANRAFTTQFITGGISGLRWPGTIYGLKLYLSNLSDADRLAAEATLS